MNLYKKFIFILISNYTKFLRNHESKYESLYIEKILIFFE